jgi:hypothetical protein
MGARAHLLLRPRREYDFRKKLEGASKMLRHFSTAASVANPSVYARRFVGYIDSCVE